MGAAIAAPAPWRPAEAGRTLLDTYRWLSRPLGPITLVDQLGNRGPRPCRPATPLAPRSLAGALAARPHSPCQFIDRSKHGYAAARQSRRCCRRRRCCRCTATALRSGRCTCAVATPRCQHTRRASTLGRRSQRCHPHASVLALDVERNPGPATGEQQEAGNWLGVTDAVALRILEMLRTAAKETEALGVDLTVDQAQDRPGHGWNHPVMRVLAYWLDSKLGAVRLTRSPHSSAVAGLPDSHNFARHRREYFPQSPFNDPELLKVKATAPDGNCCTRSLVLGVSGSEAGWAALRLRCLIELMAASPAYYAAREAAAAINTTDFTAREFHRLATPGSWLSDLTSAAAATVLQCPVLLYSPGYGHVRGREHNTAYIPPLFVRAAEEYANKTPLLQLWAHAGSGNGAQVAEQRWQPNHFETGFLTTPDMWRELLQQSHSLSPPAYYSARDPRLGWETRTHHTEATLSPEQRRLLRGIQLDIENVLPQQALRPPGRTRKGNPKQGGPAWKQRIRRAQRSSTTKAKAQPTAGPANPAERAAHEASTAQPLAGKRKRPDSMRDGRGKPKRARRGPPPPPARPSHGTASHRHGITQGRATTAHKGEAGRGCLATATLNGCCRFLPQREAEQA